MGLFLVHRNPKADTLQGLSFMEGSPIKGITLAFPRLYFLLPGPHAASKTEPGGHQTPQSESHIEPSSVHETPNFPSLWPL